MLKGEQELGFEGQVSIRRNFQARGYDKAISLILYVGLCLSLIMVNPPRYKKNPQQLLFKIGIYLSCCKVTHLLGLRKH